MLSLIVPTDVRPWVLCLLAGACGSSPSGPPSYPTFEEDRRGVTPTSAEARELSNSIPTQPQPSAKAEVGLSRALVASVGARRLYIDEFKTLRLFADERLAAQELLAAWAAGAGLSILPPKEVERAFELAASGKHAQTGVACGPPLDRDTAAERWMSSLGAAGKISAAVRCDGDCTLQVSVELTGLGTEFYAAPYDPEKPWREELPRRLAQVVDNGGHERHGHGNNPVAVAGVKATAASALALVSDTSDPVLPESAMTAAGKACGVGLYSVAVLLDGGAGAPRCERLADPLYVTDVDPARNACVCAAVLKEAKLEGGRKVVRVDGPEPGGAMSGVTKNGLRVYADAVARDDEGRVRWFFPGFSGTAALEHCFGLRSQVQPQVEVSVTLDFDLQGAVTKVVLGDVAGVLKKDERACVLKTLQTARAPCLDKPAIGVGSVSVAVRAD